MPPDLIALPSAAVETAISQLRRMAGHLDGVGGSIDTSAVSARVDWLGGHRDDFDIFVPGLVHRHGDLATQLRNLAGDLEDAAASVARENQRRTDAWEEAEHANARLARGVGCRAILRSPAERRRRYAQHLPHGVGHPTGTSTKRHHPMLPSIEAPASLDERR